MKNAKFRRLIEILEEHKSSKSDTLVDEVMRANTLNSEAHRRIREVKQERRKNEKAKKEYYKPGLIVVRLDNEHDTAMNLFNKITSKNPEKYVLIFHSYGIIHGFKDHKRLKLNRLPTEENEIIELIIKKLKLLHKVRTKNNK